MSSAQEAYQLFKKSPFYLDGCNNESAPLNDLGSEVLLGLKGHEYVVTAASAPGLWIILHRYRKSREVALLLGVFYIVNGQVHEVRTFSIVLLIL